MPILDIWMEFWLPGFSLAQPLAIMGIMNSESVVRYLSLFSVSAIIKYF